MVRAGRMPRIRRWRRARQREPVRLAFPQRVPDRNPCLSRGPAAGAFGISCVPGRSVRAAAGAVLRRAKCAPGRQVGGEGHALLCRLPGAGQRHTRVRALARGGDGRRHRAAATYPGRGSGTEPPGADRHHVGLGGCLSPERHSLGDPCRRPGTEWPAAKRAEQRRIGVVGGRHGQTTG